MLNSQRPIVRCHFLKVLLGDRLNRIFGALFEHLSLFLKDSCFVHSRPCIRLQPVSRAGGFSLPKRKRPQRGLSTETALI
jgi:hypothetical protein